MLTPPIELTFLTAHSPRSVPETRYAEIRVVPLAELAWEDRGFTRGHAHIGFDDYPPGAPGRLDFSPVKLAALQSIDAGKGYPMHPHTDIETLTFVLDGTLSHEDSLGHRELVGASELAVLTAGRGIEHAEFAHGSSAGRALLFWVEPSVLGAEPRFRRAPFPKAARANRFVALASGGANAPREALPLLRDVTLYAAHAEPGATISHALEASRRAYLVATDAAMLVNGRRVEAGERVLAHGPGELEVRALGQATEIALFDID